MSAARNAYRVLDIGETLKRAINGNMETNGGKPLKMGEGKLDGIPLIGDFLVSKKQIDISNISV